MLPHYLRREHCVEWVVNFRRHTAVVAVDLAVRSPRPPLIRRRPHVPFRHLVPFRQRVVVSAPRSVFGNLFRFASVRWINGSIDRSNDFLIG